MTPDRNLVPLILQGATIVCPKYEDYTPVGHPYTGSGGGYGMEGYGYGNGHHYGNRPGPSSYSEHGHGEGDGSGNTILGRETLTDIHTVRVVS